MEQLFDFLDRLGAVTLGIFVAGCLIIIFFAALIELIDFLIVDPIKRSQNKSSPTEEVLFDSKEND